MEHNQQAVQDKNNESDPMPCLLFFDSLRAHEKERVQSNVIEWLNYEWKRLGKSTDNDKPFSKSSMPVLAPRSKFYSIMSLPCSPFSQTHL